VKLIGAIERTALIALGRFVRVLSNVVEGKGAGSTMSDITDAVPEYGIAVTAYIISNCPWLELAADLSPGSMQYVKRQRYATICKASP
jgi:hypothetical protein